MTTLDLRSLAAALGGEVSGQRVLAPGPGHSRKDRSLSVSLSSTARGAFICHSFAGDDWRDCRDHVAAALGLSLDAWRTKSQGHGAPERYRAPVPPREPLVVSDRAVRIARAIWDTASDAHGSVVERYLASRGLTLPLGADALRYHPRTPWHDEAAGRTIFVPCMVAAMRQVDGDALTAIHRTRLTAEGAKLGRKMRGAAAGAAIKLDDDAEVTTALHIGEGVETVQQGRQLGLRPGWALGSAGAIAAFPVLPGVEALAIHAERDDTNRNAVETCAARWHAAGREVTIIEPRTGSDLNDAVREASHGRL